jgi:hypothetical protein
MLNFISEDVRWVPIYLLQINASFFHDSSLELAFQSLIKYMNLKNSWIQTLKLSFKEF